MIPLIYIIILVAMLVGLKLPDIDLAPIFWHHRSAWTHGPVIPFVLVHFDSRWPAYHYAWMAMLAGVAIHLAADLFPKRWQGMALINFHPLKITLSPMNSGFVIFSGSIISAYLCWLRL
jgi:membrane-bound metal-dependent hydrolase YbcI (DUF457 family)